MRIAPLRRAGLASDAEVLDRVHRVLGPVEVAEDVSVSPARGRVLRIVTRSEESSFAKWYRDVSDYQRELDALTLYTPALGSDAPRLIDNDDALHLLLISAVAGTPAAGTGFEWDPLVHYRAGVLLRKLHESAPGVSSDQFARQCATRFEAAASQLDGVIESHALAAARLMIAAAMDVTEHHLVPTHRDNHPRNWMVDPSGHVRLIDFAHAEYDPWIVDVLLLEQDYWRSDPNLQVAFFSGYDREITAVDTVLLRAHHAVVAVQALVATRQPGATKGSKTAAKDMFDRLVGVTLF